MHIQSIDPANMRGHAGSLIQDLDGYFEKRNGVFSRKIPSFRDQLWYRCEADGLHLPTMAYKGENCFLNEIMCGKFGEDYAASVRHQDPKFARAAAGAFPQAAEGFPVYDRVQMEVTPPGFTRPRYVDYYRSIRRFRLPVFGRPIEFLSVLVVPTDEWRAMHIAHSIEHHGGMIGQLHN